MAHSLDERAESARVQLYDGYNRLNALWSKAEEKLTKYHLPHTASHEYDTDCDPNTDEPLEGYCLAIAKIGNEWRICHGTYPYQWRELDIEWKPIVDCSAWIRTTAVKGLPGLQEAIVVASERFIPRVERANEELERFLSDTSHLLAERHRLNGKK